MQITRNKFLLIIIILLDALSIGILIPVLPAIFQAVTLPVVSVNTALNTVFWYALVIGMHPICAFFAAPFLGVLSDRVGRKPVLVFSLFCSSIAFGISVVGIVSGSVWLLMVGRIIDGSTSGNIAVARASLIDQTDPDKMTSILGVIGALFGIGMILGPLIGSVSWNIFGLPQSAVAVAFATIITGVASVLTLLFFRETHFPKPGEFHEPLQFLPKTEKILRPMIFAAVLYVVAFAMFTTYWAVFLNQVRGFDEKQIANMFILIGVSVAVTQGLIVRIVSRYVPARNIVLIFSPFFVIAILLCAYAVGNALYLAVIFFALMNGLNAANRLSMLQKAGAEFGKGYISGIDASYSSLAAAISPVILVGSSFLGVYMPFVFMSLFILGMWLVTMFYTESDTNLLETL